MRSLTMTRRTRFLATGAVVFAVGLGGGGLAFAASPGSAPALTPAGAGCKGLHLSPVHGVKPPKVTATLAPVRAYGKPVVCGSGGYTSGR